MLVSVRDAVEAAAALAGGCDIVDVKEPARGPLGRADAGVLAEVVARVRAVAPDCPVSAALGELREWTEDGTAGAASLASFALPAGVAYAKLGLSGAAGISDWPQCWRRVRAAIDSQAAGPPMWVAVVYADWSAAEAPPPSEVLAAVDARCAAVLVDTYRKDGRSVLDHLTPVELRTLAEATHAAGLRFAVAGSLGPATLPRLKTVPCDLVAIRTAACRDSVRSGPICPHATRRFADTLATVFR